MFINLCNSVLVHEQVFQLSQYLAILTSSLVSMYCMVMFDNIAWQS